MYAIIFKRIMKLKDMKISWQLLLAFTAMMAFVISLGIVATQHAVLLNEQTHLIYNHPLKVRKAIGELKSDIARVQVSFRDIMLASTDDEIQTAIQSMKLEESDAFNQFEILKSQYLGPENHIKNAYACLLLWNLSRDENIKLVRQGKIDVVKDNLLAEGAVGKYRELLLQKINLIDEFASKRSDFLFNNSLKLKDSLNQQMIGLISLILLVSIFISYFLIHNIRMPINELSIVSKRFQAGDLSVRSAYKSKNEFGGLSDSFNSMMESIQKNMEMAKKTAQLSDKMMSEELARNFFKKILPALSENTNSQMAAVYILNEDKKCFEHYESIGLADDARLSFGVDSLQGEFGPVLASRTIQFVKRIPIDTRFVFQTVSGKFIPREIVTIPILSGSDVIAIISLASVRTYSEDAIELINHILDTLNARVEGVLTYRKMRKFSELLEAQNLELEAQKMELASQSNELTEQNTELEMQKNQLTEASRLKTNFLSNMSHELRTPLNSVIALSGVLSRRLSKKIPDDEYSYIEVIERNGKHLLSLINDILDISRIEAGHEEVEIINFNANEIVSEIVEMIQPQAVQKRIKLIHSDVDNEIMVSGDTAKYKHILQNLIGNAVKFTEKGKVEVSVHTSDDKVNILVTDSGIGITVEEMKHIFDEFRQADGSTSRRFGGSGLGLAIAKKYANLLGGTIAVKSESGVGSTFTLTMPLKYDPMNRIYDMEIPKSNHREAITIDNTISKDQNTQKTILLVEDSEPAIIQIKDFLEESGYKILTAHNGADALEIINLLIPDAMILDLMMPGVDGFEVLKSLREVDKTAHIPVLVLTAKHITKEDLDALKRNNIHQLIQKGDINRADLLDSIARMTKTEAVVEVVKPKEERKVIKGKPCVLIVEDNPDNMITVKAILGDNYTIIEAIDGHEGIAMAKKYVPDFVLMDIAMPGLNGVEAFKEIRRIGELSHIPIIALTASAMTSDRETILAHGFDGYLIKPIDEKVFFKTINHVLFGK